MNSTSIHQSNLDVINLKPKHQEYYKRSQTIVNVSNITTESEINIELYSARFFDGVTGLDAQLPHFKDYWDGYALGYREYCCGLLGVKIPASEIPLERLASLITA